MTLAIGEFIGSLIVAFVFGGVFAVILWGERIKVAGENAKLDGWNEGWDARAKHLPKLLDGERVAVRATIRDAFSLLPRLHCSRSVSGHVRVSDVERMLAEGTRDG